MNIVKEIQIDKLDKVISHIDYAGHNLKIIREKLKNGEELNALEQKLLEGYI